MSIQYPAARVLIVDDEPLVLRVIERALRRICVVESVADGGAALERLRRGDFALVLSDLMMPRLDGLALLEAVHQEAPDQAARFAIMTGGARTPQGEALLEAAGVPVLAKPFDAAQLIGFVRSYLERHRAHEPQLGSPSPSGPARTSHTDISDLLPIG